MRHPKVAFYQLLQTNQAIGLMHCRCLYWVSKWMAPPFRLLSASVLAWHFVNHIVAITVVVRSLPLPPMALVVPKAKVVITIIVRLMISFTGLLGHLEFHHDLNSVESLVPMVRGQMVLPWIHGNVENFLHGMLHVWPLMHLLIAELHQRRQGQWLTKLRDPNMYLFAPIVIERSGVFGNRLFHS